MLTRKVQPPAGIIKGREVASYELVHRRDRHARRKHVGPNPHEAGTALAQGAQRRDEKGECRPRFESDDCLYGLLESMFTDDSFSWLPEGTTGDMTAAPMVGILGDEMPGPSTDKGSAVACTTAAGGKSRGSFGRCTNPF